MPVRPRGVVVEQSDRQIVRADEDKLPQVRPGVRRHRAEHAVSAFAYGKRCSRVTRFGTGSRS